MKKKSRNIIAFLLVVCVTLGFPSAVFAWDFSNEQPKTVALEGVDGYTTYGGTAKIGMTWSTNDPEKLVGALFNLVKKDGVDIPYADPFYVAKPEGSGNEWQAGPKGYLAFTVNEFASETAKWSIKNVTEPHKYEFSAKDGAQFTNNIYEYEEHLVGSPAAAYIKMLYPVDYNVSAEGKIEYPIQHYNSVTSLIAPVQSAPVTGNQSDYAILDEDLKFTVKPVSPSKVPTVKYSLDNGGTWHVLAGNKTPTGYDYTYKRTHAANPLTGATDGVKFDISFQSTVMLKYKQGTGGNYTPLPADKAYNAGDSVNVDFTGNATPDPGKVFVGWTDDNGTVYTNGFTSTVPPGAVNIIPNKTISSITTDTTLTATWSTDENHNGVPDSLEVTFKYVTSGMNGAAASNQNSEESQAKSNLGNTPVAIADPAADTGNGYEFKGWKYRYKGNDFDNVSTNTIKGQTFTEDVVFTAEFGLVSNTTITWNLAGGAWTPAGQSAFPGGTSSGPAGAPLIKPDPNIHFNNLGYTFIGWDHNPPANFPGAPATFTAMWTADAQTLTYSPGTEGGNATGMPSPLTENHNTGDTVTAAPAPASSSGSTFKYWQVSGAWSGVVTAGGTFVMPAGAVTLTAIWNSPGAVNITFDPNGGVWSDDTKTSRNDPSVAVGGTFDVHEIPTLAGHTFDGWASSDTANYPDLGATVTVSAPAIAGKPVTYTAKWIANTNNVTFLQGDNGTITPNPTVESVVTGSAPANIPLAVPTAGYVFVGWKDSINGGIYDKKAVEKYVINQDVTFTAQYAAAGKAVVVFNYDGGTDGTGGYKLIMGNTGDPYTVPVGGTDFTKQGFDFDGWDVVPTGTFGTAGMVDTYKAKWKPSAPGTCTVTFLKGSNGSMTPAVVSNVVNKGTKVTGIPAITANTGFTFTGWMSSENNGVYNNTALQDYVLSGDVTFTAQYVQQNKTIVNSPSSGTTYYVLSFRTNGGEEIDPVNGIWGEMIDLAKYVPKKPGNIFMGWFSDKELKNEVKSVRLDENKIVYAKWGGLTSDRIAYMVGYEDSTFGPDKKMARAEAAMMFYRLLDDKGIKKEVSFSDVNASAWYYVAVGALASKGIITGYEDGSFKPEGAITRAEFAAIASRFENLTKSEKTFSDVSESHWAYKMINSAATKGWINGYSDGTFRPENNITRAEVVTVVNHVLDRKLTKEEIANNIKELKTFKDVPEEYWAFADIIEATNGKIKR